MKISPSITGKLAVVELRKKMPDLKMLKREKEYGNPKDTHIGISLELGEKDCSTGIRSFVKKVIEPAVEALCRKMQEVKNTVILLTPPSPAFPSEQSKVVTYDGLSLCCHLSCDVEFRRKVVSIDLSYTEGG